jgi:hypothetical protein
VIAAAAVAGVIVLIAAGLARTARLVHVGNLDAQALADKLAGQASVAPVRREGATLELRRRQSLERVHAVMVAEDIGPTSSG